MLIVFLFLNSWRSTVITGLTLPIALIGTFLFMYMFGFTINMITLMALSLCVGLLIDDAIVVRENIVRHVQMGKTPHQAALDGTQEIGLAVLATTFSIVAVFLPIGFMGGIIGKFFHEFGITIVGGGADLDVRELHARPDAVERLARPAGRTRSHGRVRPDGHRPRPLVRPRHRCRPADALLGHPALVAAHKLATLAHRPGIFVGSFFMVPLLGTEFVPKADFSETRSTSTRRSAPRSR